MIRSVVAMDDGSEMLFLGLTASDVALLRTGRAVRYDQDDLRKAGMKKNNFTVVIAYEDTEAEIIAGVKRAGVETEEIYETRYGDIRDPGD